MRVTHKRRPRIRSFTAQVLLGIAGLAIITVVCFHLGLGVARTGFVYVILLALVSVLGSFSAAIVLSIISVA